jgi:hypothetical protein
MLINNYYFYRFVLKSNAMKTKLLFFAIMLFSSINFLFAQENTISTKSSDNFRVKYEHNQTTSSIQTEEMAPLIVYVNSIHPLIQQYMNEFHVNVISTSFYNDAPSEKKQYIDENSSMYLIVEDPIYFVSTFYSDRKKNE